MARPYSESVQKRLPVAVGESQRPELGVYAPADVATPPASTSGLAGLAQVLGLVGAVGQEYGKERSAKEYQQGASDQALGQADPNKANSLFRRDYVRGAFDTATLESYQQAEKKVSERASTELDHSLPIDQQVHQIDTWMHQELGSVITDPRARRIIGPRYQEFINTAAANIQKVQVEAHAQSALDATLQDVTTQIQRSGSFDWNEAAHRIISQTGDPTKANEMLVGAVGQAMEDAATKGDPNWKKLEDLIPGQVTSSDGSQVPGPLYNPKYRGILQQSRIKAENLYDKFHEDRYAASQFNAYTEADQMLFNNVPITKDTFAAKGWTIGKEPSDTFSPSVAAQYIQTSQERILRAQQAKQEQADYVGARGVAGRWADVRGVMDPSKYSEDKRNDAADAWMQQLLVAGGAHLEDLGGAAMARNPGLVTAVARLSAQEGLPYRPLKDTLNSINPSAPGDVTARLPAYKLLKARGLAGMYVTDDAALVYEKAISAENAGEGPQGIADAIKAQPDKDTAVYVANNLRQSTLRKNGVALETGNGFLSFGARTVNSNDTLNAPQVAAKLETLVTAGLSKGLTLTEAEQNATTRLQQTHTALLVGDKWAIVPNDAIPGGNAQAATKALDWYTQQLPELAKKRGIPKDEELTVRPTMGLGKQLEFEVTRAGGVELPNTRFTISGLIDAFYKAHPERSPQGEAATKHKRMIDAANATEAAAPNGQANVIPSLGAVTP